MSKLIALQLSKKKAEKFIKHSNKEELDVIKIVATKFDKNIERINRGN